MQSTKLKRRYVYNFSYNEVMDFAKRYEIRSPNNKENFPYYLKVYINFLKCGGKLGQLNKE